MDLSITENNLIVFYIIVCLTSKGYLGIEICSLGVLLTSSKNACQIGRLFGLVGCFQTRQVRMGTLNTKPYVK